MTSRECVARVTKRVDPRQAGCAPSSGATAFPSHVDPVSVMAADDVRCPSDGRRLQRSRMKTPATSKRPATARRFRRFGFTRSRMTYRGATRTSRSAVEDVVNDDPRIGSTSLT